MLRSNVRRIKLYCNDFPIATETAFNYISNGLNKIINLNTDNKIYLCSRSDLQISRLKLGASLVAQQ